MMDADACVPLPENVARGLSPFHRLMRSHYIGMIVMTVVLLFLAVQPLFAVGPVLLFLTWIGVFSVRGMQRFLDFASGLYMAIGLVSHVFYTVRAYVESPTVFIRHSLSM